MLKGACGALVGTFHTNFRGVKIRKLIGFGPLHFDPRGKNLSVGMFAGGPRPWLARVIILLSPAARKCISDLVY